MAKKSAKSKGYRKTVKEKPFLTKKEIITLIIIIAAIILGIVLFNAFYNDGYLDADEVQATDIVSFANKEIRDRYAKIGEIGELEGYTLEERSDASSPATSFSFVADSEDELAAQVIVSGSFLDNASLVNSNVASISSMLALSEENFSEILETEVQGHHAYVYSYSYDYYDVEFDTEAAAEEVTEEAAEDAEAEAAEETAEAAAEEAAEEKPSNRFRQTLSAYISKDDSHTLALHIYLQDDNADFYMSDDQLLDFLAEYTGCFNLNFEEK